jgi:hypothetical protein
MPFQPSYTTHMIHGPRTHIATAPCVRLGRHALDAAAARTRPGQCACGCASVPKEYTRRQRRGVPQGEAVHGQGKLGLAEPLPQTRILLLERLDAPCHGVALVGGRQVQPLHVLLELRPLRREPPAQRPQVRCAVPSAYQQGRTHARLTPAAPHTHRRALGRSVRPARARPRPSSMWPRR